MWVGQNIMAGSVLQGKAAHLLAAREQAEQSESEVPGMTHLLGHALCRTHPPMKNQFLVFAPAHSPSLPFPLFVNIIDHIQMSFARDSFSEYLELTWCRRPVYFSVLLSVVE